MATPSVLTFDAEGRAVDFEVWVDDLQLFLQCDREDGLSLFDLTSGASPAPAADADATVRSQWAMHDAAARLAVRRHLPTTERGHFSQYKSAKTLYDAVVARYSSPATVALSRLMLPYLFPDLAAFPTVADLITHLRTSDTRYRAALPAEGVLPPPSCPLLPLLLRPTSLVSSRSALRVPRARDAAPARARGARALEGLEGSVEVVVEAVEGVGVVVGVVPGVAAAAALEAAEAVEVAEGAEATEVVEEAEVEEAAEAVAAAVAEAAVVERVATVRRGVAPVVRGGGFGPCAYVLRTGDRAGEQCVGPHSTQRCFGRLRDVWRRQFPEASEIPRWGDQTKAGVAIFDLDFDAILATMYAVDTSVEGACYLCVPPDPGIEDASLGAGEAAALGASASAAPSAGESALLGTALAQAFHTFTLDSGASRSFFRDRTTLTLLSRLVAVSLADPSGGPVLASFSTVLRCPAAPSGTLSGLYLPSFSTNLVSGADLQNRGVDEFNPASLRVTHCKCARTGRHLATFTRRPGSSLYTLTSESPPTAKSAQVAASSQVFAAASRSGPESAPCSYRLLSHQTLLWHDCLGHPSLPRLRGMASRVLGRERYFLLVVDDYSRYTTVFPLRSKGDVTEVLIDWIRAARLQLRESFGSDFLVLRLHSDRGGKFSSARLGAFCRAQGIRQTFTLPASPQKNGIAERRIGMVMDVARTSMMHAAAPLFLWSFAVQYAAHQLNLQSRVSLQETSPTLRWTGKVGNASVFRVWGCRAFVRELSEEKLSPRAVPCVFLGSPPVAPVWQFYHPTLRRVLSSQDVTFHESVPYYRVFPYRTAPLPPPPLFLAPGPPQVDPLTPQGPAPSGVLTLGVLSLGALSLGELSLGVWSLGVFGLLVWPPAVLRRGGSRSLHTSCASGLPAAGDVLVRLGVLMELLELVMLELLAVLVLLEVELLGVLALVFLQVLVRLWVLLRLVVLTVLLELVLLKLELLGVLALAMVLALVLVRVLELALLELEVLVALVLPLGSQSQLQPASPLPTPSPYTAPTGGLVERLSMALRPSTAPLRVPLPSPPESSLPSLADPDSDSLRAASLSVTCLLATLVTNPSFESTAASALVAELVDFAARCRLDYAASLVAESESVCPPSVGGECTLSTDVLEDRQEEFQCFAADFLHLVSMLIAPEGDPDAPDIPFP
ncbi:unnamed protein product [Closterium sp. NIES-65]|nr:unnamed protein product [Closterium sp. NIES-65]